MADRVTVASTGDVVRCPECNQRCVNLHGYRSHWAQKHWRPGRTRSGTTSRENAGLPRQRNVLSVTVAQIQAAVCLEFGITSEEMASKRRPDRIAIPRMVAMYLARWITHRTLHHIATAFGKADHTTVCHAARERIPQLMAADLTFETRVNALQARLQGTA